MRNLVMTSLMCLFVNTVYAGPVFEILPLGVYGGVTDGNLSSYLVKPLDKDNYAALDVGALVGGLEVAVDKNAVHNKTIEQLLQKHIPSYLISHAHLDHYLGLVMAQPELKDKQTFMARQETMQALENHIFTWSVWGNFGDEGETPRLNLQHYQTIPLREWVAIPGTSMEVYTLPLSHGGMPASAFLIRYQNAYVLYFGDTGSDAIEKSTFLENVWNKVAPLVRNKQLHAIMLECSFLNSQPEDKLFGHLKPSLFMAELRRLAVIVNPSDVKDALKGLPVVVTHIKPRLGDLVISKEETRRQILNELSQENDIGVSLISPVQGKALIL